MTIKRKANTLPKLGDRLKKWRKSQEHTLKGITQLTGCTAGPLSEMENNKSFPSVETLTRFHKKTNLNIMWLLFDEGRMLKPNKKK
jgi:transcriptional regulator with XRE-family HTH domain